MLIIVFERVTHWSAVIPIERNIVGLRKSVTKTNTVSKVLSPRMQMFVGQASFGELTTVARSTFPTHHAVSSPHQPALLTRS